MIRAAAAALTFLLMASPAHAALKLCNRTSFILYAATSELSGGQATNHGWTRIAPGDCTIALPEKLTAQTYVYARSGLSYSGPEHAWGGDFSSCVENRQFTLHQLATEACSGTAFAVPFAKVDRSGTPDWTMTFDESPLLPGLEAAQLAGVKRLLMENGYKISEIDGKPDKATGAALKDFRAKMPSGDRTDNAQLFAALERGALAHGAAPDGYTVCNDGNADVMAAIAERNQDAIESRGWWKIGHGACARLITTALNGAQVWLLAKTPAGSLLVSGPDKFCTAPQAFQIKSRNCPLSQQAGFALTPGTLAGRIVRLTANIQTAMPK